MNTCTLIGRVGKDAQHKPDVGQGLATFSLATNERWKDKHGEWQDSTTWHNVVVWGEKQSARAASIAKKGVLLMVIGSIKSRSYDKDGEKRTAVEINAQTVEQLVAREKPDGSEPAKGKVEQAQEKAKSAPIDDDEIPF